MPKHFFSRGMYCGLMYPAPLEIEAGNRLRIRTVQVLRAGVTRGNNASHYIYDLAELKDLLGRHQNYRSRVTGPRAQRKA